MIKLHGSPISNYYNIVKLCLLEKGLDFEEVLKAPSQDSEFLAISPMGKIPVLQVREGFISESKVIVEFLEDIYPEIALYPKDPYEKAMVRRLCHMVELYIDVPLRPLMTLLLRGGQASTEMCGEIKGRLERGLEGLSRVVKVDPWLAGSEFSAADIYGYYCFGLAGTVAMRYLDLDIYTRLPDLTSWNETMSKRDTVSEVDRVHRLALDKLYTVQPH